MRKIFVKKNFQFFLSLDFQTGKFIQKYLITNKWASRTKNGSVVLNIIGIFLYVLSVCVAQSDITMSGVCLTSDECDEQSGTKDGNCASGFGVCCVIL